MKTEHKVTLEELAHNLSDYGLIQTKRIVATGREKSIDVLVNIMNNTVSYEVFKEDKEKKVFTTMKDALSYYSEW